MGISVLGVPRWFLLFCIVSDEEGVLLFLGSDVYVYLYIVILFQVAINRQVCAPSSRCLGLL